MNFHTLDENSPVWFEALRPIIRLISTDQFTTGLSFAYYAETDVYGKNLSQTLSVKAKRGSLLQLPTDNWAISGEVTEQFSSKLLVWWGKFDHRWWMLVFQANKPSEAELIFHATSRLALSRGRRLLVGANREHCGDQTQPWACINTKMSQFNSHIRHKCWLVVWSLWR